jgi:HEPN domain-containing protein
MDSKKMLEKSEIIFDFGDDFGKLEKHDISSLYIEIHATVSPLDPLSKEIAPINDN